MSLDCEEYIELLHCCIILALGGALAPSRVQIQTTTQGENNAPEVIKQTHLS